MKHLLLGNSFPLSLIRHPVRIEPRSVEDLKLELRGAEIHSFWGHANTRELASDMIGMSLFRGSERPALTLTEDRKPVLNGIEFHECWILSPDYVPGFRPAVGEEVHADQIQGWQVLKISWGAVA